MNDHPRKFFVENHDIDEIVAGPFQSAEAARHERDNLEKDNPKVNYWVVEKLD